MFYREAGQFKTNYAADLAVFPIMQDQIGLAAILFIAAVIIPWFGSSFLIQAVMIPFLIFSLAAIGLNLLTGYTGLLSLGTGAFMGVGAYACYKLTSYFPSVNILIWIVASGFFGGCRRSVRIAVAANQGILSGGGDARRAVLLVVVLHPAAVVL
jgi:branched-chain amino acid transport system permease protein